MIQKARRSLGSIFTPTALANFLASWAIQDREARVLDVGTGEGVFIFAAYRQLQALGATIDEAQSQIYGTEISDVSYREFVKQAEEQRLVFPNVVKADFFEKDFCDITAVIGNPPYVRRTYLNGIDRIREKVLQGSILTSVLTLPRSTDLYVYFLLKAMATLKPGGRIAVVIADSWLTVGYGDFLKDYLKRHFQIDSLISLDRRVFHDAQVKPVLLLATRRDAVDANHQVTFMRIKNGLPIESFAQLLKAPEVNVEGVGISLVESSMLAIDKPWSIHFKAPELYEALARHRLMTPIAGLGRTRIGVQTLAKEFFVLTSEEAHANQIEAEYLQPLAQSPRFFRRPVIEPGDEAGFHLFYCSKNKEDLENTHALEYILRGEMTEVEVRGKNSSVIGYQNKERIQRASRKEWYDLKSLLQRRGRDEILIPRLLYRTYMVIWNKAKFVPGELFIEFQPLPLPIVDTEVYLAILTSSVTEIMLRIHAQIYGGGTYNMNPGEIRNVPILNAPSLEDTDKEALKSAFLEYIVDDQHNREEIDKIVYKILQLDEDMQRQAKALLEDLVHLATSSKNKATPENDGVGQPAAR